MRDPAARDDLAFQQRQDDVAAAEHQRARAGEAVEDSERLRLPGKDRQQDQQPGKGGEGRKPARARQRQVKDAGGRPGLTPAQDQPGDRPGHDRAQHPGRAGHQR